MLSFGITCQLHYLLVAQSQLRKRQDLQRQGSMAEVLLEQAYL